MTLSTTFTITGEKEFQRRLIAIGKAPKEILRETGIRGVYAAKQIHRPNRKTGNLERTIRMGNLTDTYVEIRAGGQFNVGYAGAVEHGSRPHIIIPRKASVLAWGGPRTLGGRLRSGARATNFAKRVNHPGSRPYPYLVPGLVKALTLVGLGGLVKRWNEAA